MKERVFHADEFKAGYLSFVLDEHVQQQRARRSSVISGKLRQTAGKARDETNE